MPAQPVERAEAFRAMPRPMQRMPTREPETREADPYARNTRGMDAAPPRSAYVPRQQPAPAAMPAPRMMSPPGRSESTPPARNEGNARKARTQDERHRKDQQQNQN